MASASSSCCGSGVNVELASGRPWLPPFLLDSPPASGEVAFTSHPFPRAPLSAPGIRGLPAQAFLGPCYCGWTLNVSIRPSGLRDLALSFLPLPSPTLPDIILQPLPFSDLPASAYSNAAHHCEPRGSTRDLTYPPGLDLFLEPLPSQLHRIFICPT